MWIILSQKFGQSSDFSLIESDISMESSNTEQVVVDDDNNWRLKLLDFPRPGTYIASAFLLCQLCVHIDVTIALYDTGLSNSLQVSVHVSQIKNASNATFTFMV